MKKTIFQAIVPDDPELDYSLLEGIHNGGDATETYLAMWKMTDEEMTKKCQELNKYCGLDTYAMVKMWSKLKEISGCE